MGWRWEIRREDDLSVSEHRMMARTLSAALGGVRAADAEHFTDGRSWAGARPEFRLITRDDEGVAAHIGVLRRFVEVGGRDRLVADLGLFAVRPDRQRHGLGGELLAELREVLTDLAVPFGFLGCRVGLVDFYSRNGWHRLPETVRVRHVDNRDPWHIDEFAEALFVQPVAAPLEAWPDGEVIDRNGMEV